MLPVIEAGARTFLAGKSPYTTYEHIPWRPTLPYGPSFWLPFTLPVIARADVRILTLIGYLTVVSSWAQAPDGYLYVATYGGPYDSASSAKDVTGLFRAVLTN